MLPAVGEEEPYLDSDPYAAPALGGGSRKRTRQVGCCCVAAEGAPRHWRASSLQALAELALAALCTRAPRARAARAAPGPLAR